MMHSVDEASPGGPRPGDAAFRAIVVATDLSEVSEALLRAASAVAGRTGATLHVVHAAELPLGAPPGPEGIAEHVAKVEVEADEQIRRVIPAGAAVERHVEVEVPHEAILGTAERVRADLIVVGPHVRGGGGSPLLGSTAQRVLNGARVPCLIVRAPVGGASRHVVAAVDPAHLVAPVLDSALRWALLVDAGDGGRLPRVSALYVTVERDGGPPPELERALRSAVERSGAAGKVDAAVAVRGTDVVQSILLYAEAEGSDLLVLSSHNRGFMGRKLLGSVSEEVARRAPCNVLLVPPPPEA